MRVSNLKNKKIYEKVIEYYYNICDTIMFVSRKDGFDEKEKKLLDKTMKKVEKDLKNSYIKKVHKSQWVTLKILNEEEQGIKEEDFIKQFSVYYYKFSFKVKRYLLSNKYIYNWLNPRYPEDLSFFKNGYCLFHTITHEHEANIEIRNKKEYEYFKSIGVKFYDEYYESKDLYYEDI